MLTLIAQRVCDLKNLPEPSQGWGNSSNLGQAFDLEGEADESKERPVGPCRS
jgi:hypothetical protein